MCVLTLLLTSQTGGEVDHTSIERREKDREQSLEIEAIREERRRKREYEIKKEECVFHFAGDW